MTTSWPSFMQAFTILESMNRPIPNEGFHLRPAAFLLLCVKPHGPALKINPHAPVHILIVAEVFLSIIVMFKVECKDTASILAQKRLPPFNSQVKPCVEIVFWNPAYFIFQADYVSQ